LGNIEIKTPLATKKNMKRSMLEVVNLEEEEERTIKRENMSEEASALVAPSIHLQLGKIFVLLLL